MRGPHHVQRGRQRLAGGRPVAALPAALGGSHLSDTNMGVLQK